MTQEQIQKYGIIGILSLPACAIKAAFPDYKPFCLSDIMKSRFRLCDNAPSGPIHDLSLQKRVENVEKAGGNTTKWFQKLNTSAKGTKTSEPLLVIQGVDGTIVFPDMTKEAHKNNYKAKNAVHLSLHPEQDHSVTVGASAAEWLVFIDGPFNERSLGCCSVKTVLPFDLAGAKRTPRY
ncbi:hypothetical protein NM208_g9342 [Fusarium decemcellulare]|uniref:Uncharacterized protein n=1 Tax=Fusarium decemcellulare TaxID=57161 RepID=A0ACC1S1X1_9HYPO|nr:hypothetical protein NM208_g9342 [Fusarium decemcellulare]